MKSNSTLNREASLRASSPAADPILEARRRMVEAKRRFTRAAMSALAGEAGAGDQVAAALKEIDVARESLRAAELADR